LLYDLDDSVWGIKNTVLDEFADFATLDTEKLFSKLKSHELSRKGHLLLVRLLLLVLMLVAMWLTPPILLTHLLWSLLSSLSAASDEQYKSIPNDEITLLVRKFRAFHRFHK
jgi:hypothetical protein